MKLDDPAMHVAALKRAFVSEEAMDEINGVPPPRPAGNKRDYQGNRTPQMKQRVNKKKRCGDVEGTMAQINAIGCGVHVLRAVK